MTSPQPRVWFDDEEIPAHVRVLDERGEIHHVGEDDDDPCSFVGFGPLVEVFLPDHPAAVAAEHARRASA